MTRQLLTAGIDEAGRGPWAGPVVAAAVILPAEYDLAGLTDSKKLTALKRERLFVDIKACAVSYGIGEASVEEIDSRNILQATFLAMYRAVNQLSVKPEQLLIDGRDTIDVGIPCEAVIRGDSKVDAIAAASILAKVTRDNFMIELGNDFPTYGFAKHKGYGTPEHAKALSEHGPCAHHRKSFKPVQYAMKLNEEHA